VLSLFRYSVARPDIDSISGSREELSFTKSDGADEPFVGCDLSCRASVSKVVDVSILTSSVGIASVIPTIHAVRPCTGTGTSLLSSSILVPEEDVSNTGGAEFVISLLQCETNVINNITVSFCRESSNRVTSSHREHVDIVVGRFIYSHDELVVSRDGDSIYTHGAPGQGKTLNYLSV